MATTSTPTKKTTAPTQLKTGGTYSYGQKVTDSAGRVGTVKFSSETGKPLAPGGKTTVVGGGTKSPSGYVNEKGEPIVPREATAADYAARGKVMPTEMAPEMPQEQYQIKPGENLSKIAQDNGMSVQDLLKANPNITNPNFVQSGQQIALPSGQGRGGQVLGMAKESGIPAPQTGGEAKTILDSFNKGVTEAKDTTIVDTTLAQDPVIAQLTKSFSELMSPPKQTETLVSEYQRLMKSSGLQAINAKLINSQKIINGTEDDIRSEVTAVNGFATDSQVLAMATARNKTLMENYNTLLATRESIQQNLNTMMSLSQQDRQMATQRMEQQFSVGMKILEYRDKMHSNAVEAYGNVVKNVGYEGLYSSLAQDPYALSVAEKALGVGQGGIQRLAQAQRAQTQQAFSQEMALKNAGKAGISGGIGGFDNETMQTALGIAQGYGSIKDLTPSKRGEVIGYLNANGIQLPEQKGAVQRADEILKLVEKIDKTKGQLVLGTAGVLTRMFPGTTADVLQGDVKRLKALLSADSLKMFKGLGSMSDIEFENAQASATSLSQRFREKDFQYEIDRIRNAANRIKEANGFVSQQQGTIVVAPDGTEVEIVD